MPSRLKKNIMIILATLFGVTIIFFAQGENKVFWSKTTTTTDQPVVGDVWRDTLAVVPQHSSGVLLDTEYTRSGATTTTNFIANEVVANYAHTQVSKGAIPLDDTDVQGIVQTISEKTRTVDSIKQYNEQDLVIIPSSTSTRATYQKDITDALNTFAQRNKTSELVSVAQALDNKDASKLAPLADNIANYETLVRTLRALSVPRTALTFHLSLLQGYANILAGIIDMQEILADPVRGMRGIAKYNNGAGLIDAAVATTRAQK